MTTREIKQAINDGRTIVLRHDEGHMIVPDLFGNLVVVSRRNDDEPVRLCTLGDKRRAKILSRTKR
ncbi:MAG: hypothetical protein IJV24_07010 [Prevotella sp.]|nr:hypothetical protein [Prevotella sp.]